LCLQAPNRSAVGFLQVLPAGRVSIAGIVNFNPTGRATRKGAKIGNLRKPPRADLFLPVRARARYL
jgi:hypothetical protein